MKAVEYILAQPWMITEEMFRKGIEIACREHDPSAAWEPWAVQQKSGRPLDGTRDVTVRDGVAVVPVVGTIFRYANFMSEFSGGTTIETLAKDFKAAVDDPSVKAILLEVNSPGGQVDGTGELANAIYAARGTKPIYAYVSNLGASAAYYIASAADKVYAAPSAMLGSIGVKTAVRKPDAPDKARSIDIISSQSPNKVPDVTTEKGRSQYQSLIDDLAAVFVADVARFRGVSEDKVVSDFGAGGILVGSAAVAAGLADKVGTFEGTLADLTAKVRRQQLRIASGAAASAEPHTNGGPTMGFDLFAWLKSQPPEAQAAVLGNAVPQASHDPEPRPQAPPAPAPSNPPPTAPAPAPTPTPAPTPPPHVEPVPANAAASGDNAALMARIRQLEEKNVASEADNWIVAQFQAGRLGPTEIEQVKALYCSLSLGAPASLAQYKASVESRPASPFLKESVGGALPAGAHVLEHRSGGPANPNAPPPVDRIKALLALTPAGAELLQAGHADRYDGRSIPRALAPLN